MRRLKVLTDVIVIAVVDVLVFGYESSLIPLDRARFNLRFGAVPSETIDAWRTFVAGGPDRHVLASALALFTASYLHVDAWHLVGNLLFLWVFANVLIPVVGRAQFVRIYILGGVIAAITYVLASPTSEFPMVGASGAVAAVEGAYFTLVLRWRLPEATVWPLVEQELRPRAFAFLAGAGFVVDASAFVTRSPEPVAYQAHVGGFLAGVVLAMLMKSPATAPESRKPHDA
jgi:membrane associated rhomboid family serine protease